MGGRRRRGRDGGTRCSPCHLHDKPRHVGQYTVTGAASRGGRAARAPCVCDAAGRKWMAGAGQSVLISQAFLFHCGRRRCIAWRACVGWVAGWHLHEYKYRGAYLVCKV